MTLSNHIGRCASVVSPSSLPVERVTMQSTQKLHSIQMHLTVWCRVTLCCTYGERRCTVCCQRCRRLRHHRHHYHQHQQASVQEEGASGSVAEGSIRLASCRCIWCRCNCNSTLEQAVSGRNHRPLCVC